MTEDHGGVGEGGDRDAEREKVEVGLARAVVLKPQLYQHPLECALKQRVLGPNLRASNSVSPGRGVRIFLSNKFLGDAAAPDPGTML